MRSSESHDFQTKLPPRRGLGRGLSALIPSQSDADHANAPGTHTSVLPGEPGYRLIELTKIALNPRQPRESIAADHLTELTDSIKQHGVLQPIVVRPRDNGSYELVAGERRFRAATSAGLREIPAVVREMDDQTSLAIALIENVQREDLNPIEAARAYRRLMDDWGLTQTELAHEVGKSQSTIANAVRLLALPVAVVESLAGGQISEGHAKAILTAESEQDRLLLWRECVERGLSVREAEARASALKKNRTNIPRGIAGAQISDQRFAPESARMETQLSLRLGTKVRIKYQGKERGRIEIEFYGNDQLEGLLEQINLGD